MFYKEAVVFFSSHFTTKILDTDKPTRLICKPLQSLLPVFLGNLQDGVISDEDARGWVNTRKKDR